MSEATYTKVTILGEEYRVAGEPLGAPIPELAAYVADRMGEVKGSSNTIDPKRLAVLTALNLADELLRERALSAEWAGRLRERAAGLGSTLDASLQQDEPHRGLLE